MFSPVASGIFAIRNVGKTENGEIGRAPVAVGQAAGIFKEIAKYDNTIAMGAKNAINAFREISGESKALGYAGKAVNFFSNNINPLICASSALKVAMAQDRDKDRVLAEEAGMLAFMFTGETLVAKNYDKVVNSKTVTNMLDKASKSTMFKSVFEAIEKNKMGGKIGAIVKGVTFLTASIGCSNIGSDLMKSFMKTHDKYGRECLVS